MSLAAISSTNNKLGPMIHSWSIPAGKAWSCPGESQLCRVRCYAKRGFFHMPNVSESHTRNFKFSKTPEFVPWMRQQLTQSYVRIMRIHVAGDFYTVDYTRKWYEIVSRSPRVLFFAYTRSWRIEEIFPELVKLGALSNLQLWWSIDRLTGPAPLVRGIRRAYMAVDDVDANHAPDDCDLVFRDNPGTIMKKANGIQVCPTENGVQTQRPITCSNCGICWNQRNVHWETVLSPLLDTLEITVPTG